MLASNFYRTAIKIKTEKLPIGEIQEMWNDSCADFPKLMAVTESRKSKVRQRVAEMGGAEKAMPLLREIFAKMQQSDFLKGDNLRGWKASFDWLFDNDKNWVKVYEGNYDNDTNQKYTQNATNYRQRSHDRRWGTEVIATSAADYGTVF